MSDLFVGLFIKHQRVLVTGSRLLFKRLLLDAGLLVYRHFLPKRGGVYGSMLQVGCRSSRCWLVHDRLKELGRLLGRLLQELWCVPWRNVLIRTEARLPSLMSP